MSIPDTWFTRDLPVLEATVALVDARGPHDVVRLHHIASRLGMEADDALRSLRAMRGEFVEFEESGGGEVETLRIQNVTPAARRAVGQWPTPESLADKLIAALQQAADEEPDPARKSKLSGVVQGIGSVGREVLIRVATEVVTGRVHP